MNRPFLKKAIELIGGQVATAVAVDVKQAHVWAWLNKTLDGIPEKKVIPLAKATNWAVTPHELRPDIYPHPLDGLPDHLRDSELTAQHQDGQQMLPQAIVS